jgi:Glycosyltransferase Family 4
MTRRLWVVHVTGDLAMGGQENCWSSLRRMRIAIALSCVYFAGVAERWRRIWRRGLAGDRAGHCTEAAPSLPLQLASRLRHRQADIVHTHNERPLIYATPAARLARVASVIHTKHGAASGTPWMEPSL